ncbi:MAG: class I SAM-dependent methyltransferase [Ginsengibacter sp.]
MKNAGRKLWYAITKPARIAVLDYPVVPSPLYTVGNSPHKNLYTIISSNDDGYRNLVRHSVRHVVAFEKIALSVSDNMLPAWENGFFPAVDTIVLNTILEKFRPKKYLEIGSGNSTKLAAFCRKQESLGFTIACIDPNPRREIKEIADTWLSEQVQSVSLHHFTDLLPNDIVFLDGSHVLHANSDVMWFFLEILPVIPKGVIIHIHDIYLPYDYPQWVCDRFFSEQYVLAACLLNSDAYKIICPNYYLLSDKITDDVWNELWTIPSLHTVKRHGRSFWFTRI